MAPPPGKRRSRLKSLRLRLTVATLAILPCAGCKQSRGTQLPPLSAVTIAHPVQQEVIEWDEYIGHLDAVESVDLRARVSGLIMSTPFQEGSIVKQGDTLVEIDVSPFQADLDSKVAAEN